MKQREHGALDSFAVLKKFSPPKAACLPQQRPKLPKHANEATCVYAFLRLRPSGE